MVFVITQDLINGIKFHLAVRTISDTVLLLYYIHFEITGDPCNLMALRSAIYSRIALFFALNRIFFCFAYK